MDNLNEALDKVRRDAQALHKSVAATTIKDRAALRANLQTAGTEARELALSVKVLSNSQEAETKQHLRDAASALEDAGQNAKSLAKAGDSDLATANAAVLARVTSALRSLSQVVAAKRSSAKPVNI